MNRPKPKPVAGLHRPALYNPSLWSSAEVRDYYVARTALLDRFVADLRREKPGARPQHRLIVGQRGMGKSTLLRRIAVAVEDEPALDAQWLPLNFPEEQYNVASLADFWLNCLDALGDQLEARGEREAVATIDAEVERLDRKDGEGALQALLRTAARLQRRLLLLVDNVDLVFDRIKKEDWAFREALQAHPELLLIGASSRALEATYDYQAAFYDFFKIDELRGLTEAEMRETIVNLARLRGADEVIRRVESDPGRLRVLHTLTGGNPRTAVLLYGVLLKGNDGDVRSDLEGLLDEVTPLYKARFDELPPQAQQLVDKLALNWDPMTARQLADQLGWTVNLVSAQLDRLTGAGVVEKTRSGTGKRMLFQVAERFFNIWYLMRASRRVRRKLMWLVEFLRVFFSLDELQNIARRRLAGCTGDPREAEYALALSRALGPSPLARALETQALDILLSGQQRERMKEILDLHGEDRDLLPKAERIHMRKHAKERLSKIFTGKAGERLLGKLLALPLRASSLLELAEIPDAGTAKSKKLLTEFAEDLTDQLMRWFGKTIYPKFSAAIASGEIENDEDIVGGEAAAVRYNCQALALLPKMKPLIFNGDVSAEGESLARAILAEDESAAVGWYGLAIVLRSQERWREAESSCRKALKLAPHVAVVEIELGDILLQDESRLDEAEVAYRRATELSPKSVPAWFSLSTLLMRRGRCDNEAIAAAKMLCQLEPDDSLNWQILAAILNRADVSARDRLLAARKAVELAPSDEFAQWLEVMSLYDNDQVEEAVSASLRWLRLLEKREPSSMDINSFIPLLQTALASNSGRQFMSLLDSTEAGQRYRPLREALAAAVAGNAEILNDVAPEVRKPALDILAIVAPDLVKDRA